MYHLSRLSGKKESDAKYGLALPLRLLCICIGTHTLSRWKI